jgi:hypothetical protein
MVTARICVENIFWFSPRTINVIHTFTCHSYTFLYRKRDKEPVLLLFTLPSFVTVFKDWHFAFVAPQYTAYIFLMG